ncbi:MAG: sigma-70 family RNA polymerase sigma factor [Bdellovibrionales bacterium]|nr:sigma-70 family RNA polymerase sigma factor [Bdellovibrionales bacterium]
MHGAQWEELTDFFVAYQRGSAVAVRPLFESLQRRTEQVLFKRGLKQEDVAEVTQQVLLRIHVNRERYEPDRPLRAWVSTIVRRTLIDFWRRSRKATTISHEDVELANDDSSWFGISPESFVGLKEEIKKVDTLKPTDKKIVDLYAFSGKSIEAIGEELQLSTGAIKLRLHRARKLLKGLGVFILACLGGWR